MLQIGSVFWILIQCVILFEMLLFTNHNLFQIRNFWQLEVSVIITTHFDMISLTNEFIRYKRSHLLKFDHIIRFVLQLTKVDKEENLNYLQEIIERKTNFEFELLNFVTSFFGK